jgi:tubulin polyglutamylase TTLL5
MELRERLEQQGKGSQHLTERLSFVPKVFSMPEDYHAFQQAALDNPGKRWILKPKNAARGKGIQLVKDPADVPMESSWMVQEYLENPHTMHGRKYVLRLYVLVSSVSPFRVYLYRQGFAKLASAPYNEENADNPYSYLTNPDVNALNLEAEVPVEFVDFERYRAWLREQGHDDEALFARIEDLVALTCLAALEPMRERSRVVGADTRGCYEMMGIDCLIDADLKPWVLECNLSPSLDVCAGPESGGGIEEGIKGALVGDMIGMLGLNRQTAEDAAGTMAEQLVRETRTEMASSGGFKCLIPGTDPSAYLPFMALPRLSDWVIAQALSDRPLQQPRLERWVAEDTLTEDQVYLYDTRLGHLSSLNETASLIWLMATEGTGPDDIATTLLNSAIQNTPEHPDAWTIRNDVWNTLGDWVNNRFLIQSDGQPGEHKAPIPEAPVTEASLSMVLACGRFRTRFFTDSAPLIQRIGSLLEPMSRIEARVGASGANPLSRLEVVRDRPGFTVILDGQVVRSRLPLSGVIPALAECLATHAAGTDDIAMDVGLIAGPDKDEPAFLVASSQPALRDRLTLALATDRKINFGRGALLQKATNNRVEGLGLPLEPELQAGAFVRASTGMANLRSQVAAVLVPSEEPLSKGAGLEAISVNEALTHLISSCCSEDGRPLDTQGFTRLADWLAGCERYRVDINKLESAAAALAGQGSETALKEASGGR